MLNVSWKHHLAVQKMAKIFPIHRHTQIDIGLKTGQGFLRNRCLEMFYSWGLTQQGDRYQTIIHLIMTWL